MAIIRLILGKLILFFNWAFPPRGIKRGQELQAQIDLQTASLKLYQHRACLFCVKVPCLRIEEEQGRVEWMYESGEIIGYLEDRFVARSGVAAA